jgi:hypothetical protein
MRPTRRIKLAEGVAREITKMLRSSTMSQLLQRTPSALLTAEHEALLLKCCSLLDQMCAALQADDVGLQLQLLEAVLQQQAVCSAGNLIAWMQQRPEQLLPMDSMLSSNATRGSRAAAGSWAAGMNFLDCAAAAAAEQDHQSAAARQMAADMTQQLDQSGEPCSLDCSCCVMPGRHLRLPCMLLRG